MDLSFDNNDKFPNNYQNRFSLFYDLQKYKVEELLLVSTLYDDFIIEEDGRLTEELTQEFSDLELSSPPPRIIRVSSGTEALEALENHKFDMVITMLRLSDMDPFQFGQRVKTSHPELPVVLLLTNHSDTLSLPDPNDRNGIDEIFTWNGDSDLFLAMIKIIEDKKNIDNDTRVGKVRCIIIVEDTINYYSIFLPIIYKELLYQTQNIIEEGLNLSHRLLRRRGRPKILLAQTYEEALQLYDKYKDYLLGIITDVAFPMHGEKDFSAGAELIRFIRNQKKYLPVLIQSSDPDNDSLAETMDAWFVHKNSMTYLRDFRKFMKQSMLFGDFVFKTAENGKEIDRASTLVSFEKVLREVPEESIRFHARQNHFSNWLYSRGEYTLANQLAPYRTYEFDSMEHLRQFLINSFEKRRKEKQRGVIADFQREHFDFSTPFTRIGNGSLGGKGRGIAFISALLSRKQFAEFDRIQIQIPETIVLATDIFDLFVEENNLYELLQNDYDDEYVKKRFLESNLPKGIKLDLKLIIEKTTQPLAVRSSSLLEDSQFHPLAGVYATFMLGNNQEKFEDRLKALSDAIKLVYASTFRKEAKSYIRSMGQKAEIEKMAVIIQKVVGKLHHDEDGIPARFYPDFSGVVKSFNYYPIRHMKPDDGIAECSVGLGEMVVSGGQFLSFSPNYPKILPQASTLEMALRNSQREFLAIDLAKKIVDLSEGEFSTLKKLPLEVAKKDGILKWLGAVYDHSNNRIVNSMRREGPIIITFPYLLQFPKLPLAEVLNSILDLGKNSLGYPTEIEFAVNLDYDNDENHQFYLLQIRPLVIDGANNQQEEYEVVDSDDAIIYSEISLGNGKYEHIQDIVYVKPDEFDKTKTHEIKDEIKEINHELKMQGRDYLLIGPGRWGTSDRFLGIPVRWSHIDQAQVIVEADLENFQVDPSQGMHFMTNITSTKRGYITIPYSTRKVTKARIDWGWLEDQTASREMRYIKHIRVPKPLNILINGKTCKAIITPYIKETSHEDEKEQELQI